jgi:hypothetical protein
VLGCTTGSVGVELVCLGVREIMRDNGRSLDRPSLVLIELCDCWSL